MNLKLKTFGVILLSSAALTLAACSTQGPMKTAEQSKPGFSNITDVPLPQSAIMNMNKSMVMGGGDSWTGHLVYETSKPQADVIDFTNSKMEGQDWSKISELRGKITVLSYIKEKRVATISIMTDKGYLSQKTVVSIDMTNSKLRSIKTALVTHNVDEENEEA